MAWLRYRCLAIQVERVGFETGSGKLLGDLAYPPVLHPRSWIQDPGNFNYEWGFGSTAFWLFLLRVPLLSTLMAGVYNNNRRSILSAILVHFAYNFTYSFVYPVSETMQLYGTGILLILDILIVVIWGPKTLTGKQSIRVGQED